MPDYTRIAVGATRAALSVMRSSERVPQLVDRLVDTLHELGTAVNSQLQEEGDPRGLHAPACRAGCGWCCHTDVLVSPPELLRIARHLRATRSPEELGTLRARLGDLAARTREMPIADWQRARIACPLLDAGSSMCSIHDVRPGPCRAYNSVSLPKCIELYEIGAAEVPGNSVQQRSILAVGIGLAAACRLQDFEWEGVSLTAGLAAALDDEEAPARWLAGERPFARAQTRMSRDSAPFRSKDVDAAIVGMRAHADEIPAAHRRAPQVDADEARRERNRKKRMRKGR